MLQRLTHGFARLGVTDSSGVVSTGRGNHGPVGAENHMSYCCIIPQGGLGHYATLESAVRQNPHVRLSYRVVARKIVESPTQLGDAAAGAPSFVFAGALCEGIGSETRI